jgi:hypothetical protein
MSDWSNKNVKQFLILLLVLAAIVIIYIGLYGTGEIKHHKNGKIHEGTWLFRLENKQPFVLILNTI